MALKPSGSKQPFYYANRFCGSGLQVGHSRDGFFLLRCAWDFRWEGDWGWLDGLGLDYLGSSSFPCLVPGLGWLVEGWVWQTGPPTSGLSRRLTSWQHQASQNSYMGAQGPSWEYSSKQDRNCIAFYDFSVEVTESHFCHSLLVNGLKSLPKFKGVRGGSDGNPAFYKSVKEFADMYRGCQKIYTYFKKVCINCNCKKPVLIVILNIYW